MSLFWRSFLANAVLLLVAALVLVVTPATVSHPISALEVQTVVAGVVAAFGVNLWLSGRVVRPLQRLGDSVERVDTPDTQERLPVHGSDETARITAAINRMLDRLQAERTGAARAALRAQESERTRVAGELHDQVGQSLTAVLLRIEMLTRTAPEDLRDGLGQLADTIRSTLEEVRAISTSLRPSLLADLGLVAALRALAGELDGLSSVRVVPELEEPVGATAEQELVVYRVAQEALTNVLRHADASEVRVVLRQRADLLLLQVCDDGSGMSGSPGTGLTGMRERARLVGARLEVRSRAGVGTEVSLEVPTAPAATLSSMSSPGDGAGATGARESGDGELR